MAVRKRQQGSHTIYIACEGAVSEKNYFEAIRDEVQELWDVRVEVYPKNAQSRNDAMSLVELARRNSTKFREVWAVFDKDGDAPTNALKEAKTERDGKIVNVGYSSIAFEHWVLLHFERNNNPFNKSDCKEKATEDHFYCGKPGSTHPEDCKGANCVANRVREKYIENYNKKGAFNLYDKIKHKKEQVMENAAWLRYIMNADMDVARHCQLNPYTNLDALYRRLYNDDRKIQWGGLGLESSNGDIVVTVNYSNPLVTINIVNKGTERFFINFTNNDYFFLSNEDGDKGELEFISSEIILNRSGKAEKTLNTISLYQEDEVAIKYNSVPSIKFPLLFNFNYNRIRNIYDL